MKVEKKEEDRCAIKEEAEKRRSDGNRGEGPGSNNPEAEDVNNRKERRQRKEVDGEDEIDAILVVDSCIDEAFAELVNSDGENKSRPETES